MCFIVPIVVNIFHFQGEPYQLYIQSLAIALEMIISWISLVPS